MKSKSPAWLWVLGVPVLVTLVAAAPSGGNLLLTLAVPFTMAGDILRKLSLSGELGNLGAICLYTMLCTAPLPLIRKGDSKLENGLLVLASGLLFWVMWLMINPGQMPSQMRNDVGKAIYAGTVYSVFVTWGVVKLMRVTDLSKTAGIYRALRIFLVICAVQFLLEGMGFGFSRMSAEMDDLAADNTALDFWDQMPTLLFLVLDFVLGAVENVLVGWILMRGVWLLTELEDDPYSEICHRLSGDIFVLCKKTIRFAVGANLLLNLAQVLMAPWLLNVDVTLRIPALSLCVTFAMMALTRLLGQGKALKDDNDLFI